jgi:release factor glutamine methyltransferase
MIIHEARQQLLFQLHTIYDNREAASIADLVMENITGWKKIDRIINKNVPLSLPQKELLKKYTGELLMHKPIQYVLHEAWFCGMKFFVDENVLIPRPETEELVEWIVEELKNKAQETRNTALQNIPHLTSGILDVFEIGCGSACIPISLKKKISSANIFSCDVSEDALSVAKKNAVINNVDVHFFQLDFLAENERNKLQQFDIIVSNPPYIPLHDKQTMHANVLNFEPHIALFVDDNNPLIFYNAIADFAINKLKIDGYVFAEIHESLAANVKELFLNKGFENVVIKKDMQGKDRMLKATMLL